MSSHSMLKIFSQKWMNNNRTKINYTMTSFHKPILFGTFVLSCIALALTLIALATSSWVVSSPQSKLFDKPSHVNYGLFTGRHDRTFPSATTTAYSLTMTCLFSKSVCALSCLSSSDARTKEVEALVNGDKVAFTCSSLNRADHIRFWPGGDKFELEQEERVFINAYIWLFTLIFLISAIIVTLISSVISVLNTASNPVHIVLSIYALYIWNGVAAVLEFVVILLWGIHFMVTISRNVAIRDTILAEWDSDGQSGLGMSYWCLVPAMFIHLINIGLLYFRQSKINETAPRIQAATTEQSDGTLFLY